MPRAPKINWEPIKALFLSGKTIREIAIIFGMSEAVIRNKSSLDDWGSVRKQMRDLPQPQTFKVDTNIPKRSPKVEKVIPEVRVELQSSNLEDNAKSNDAFSRAVRLRNSDNFRERIVSQANKALTTLEKAVVNNVYETDRFADALTKVERIGARAYGYDREGDHPIINIGILGSGSEYDSVD